MRYFFCSLETYWLNYFDFASNQGAFEDLKNFKMKTFKIVQTITKNSANFPKNNLRTFYNHCVLYVIFDVTMATEVYLLNYCITLNLELSWVFIYYNCRFTPGLWMKVLSSVPPGTTAIARGNEKQKLCKTLQGKGGVLWEKWKWRIQKNLNIKWLNGRCMVQISTVLNIYMYFLLYF